MVTNSREGVSVKFRVPSKEISKQKFNTVGVLGAINSSNIALVSAGTSYSIGISPAYFNAADPEFNPSYKYLLPYVYLDPSWQEFRIWGALVKYTPGMNVTIKNSEIYTGHALSW